VPETEPVSVFSGTVRDRSRHSPVMETMFSKGSVGLGFLVQFPSEDGDRYILHNVVSFLSLREWTVSTISDTPITVHHRENLF